MSFAKITIQTWNERQITTPGGRIIVEHDVQMELPPKMSRGDLVEFCSMIKAKYGYEVSYAINDELSANAGLQLLTNIPGSGYLSAKASQSNQFLELVAPILVELNREGESSDLSKELQELHDAVEVLGLVAETALDFWHQAVDHAIEMHQSYPQGIALELKNAAKKLLMIVAKANESDNAGTASKNWVRLDDAQVVLPGLVTTPAYLNGYHHG